MPKKQAKNDGAPPVEEVNLSEMTREDLVNLATVYGLNPADDASKEDIIAAILEADADRTDPPEEDHSKEEKGPPAPKNDKDPPSPKPKAQKPKDDGEKVRLKCERLKGGKKVIVGNAEVQADKDGVIEVDANEAARLLTIPGYQEV